MTETRALDKAIAAATQVGMTGSGKLDDPDTQRSIRRADAAVGAAQDLAYSGKIDEGLVAASLIKDAQAQLAKRIDK
jgi:hypothetical protein